MIKKTVPRTARRKYAHYRFAQFRYGSLCAPPGEEAGIELHRHVAAALTVDLVLHDRYPLGLMPTKSDRRGVADLGTEAGIAFIVENSVRPIEVASWEVSGPRVTGSGSDDVLWGGDGEEVLVGSPGLDVLVGGIGRNSLERANN